MNKSNKKKSGGKPRQPAMACVGCSGKLAPYLEDVFDTRFGLPGTYNIFHCTSCGLVQLSPVPRSAELKRLYETYYNFGGSGKGAYARLRAAFLGSFLYRLWMTLDGDISFHSARGTGRLLDVGCNEGRGLVLYRKNGFEAEGLELNRKAAEEAAGKGFKVHSTLLGDFEPDKPYDVVVLSNVLEHATDPTGMLKDVRRLLNKGGEVWISCPNERSWQKRLFGRAWINWHVPFHIVHFSEGSLARLLEGSGFKVRKASQRSPALWLAQSLLSVVYAKKGVATLQMRKPMLVAPLVLVSLAFFFPILVTGNLLRSGDCLVVTATRS